MVTQRNGERWSAARAYIHPFMGSRPNLQVVTEARATRILFERKRAVGVEYRQGNQIKTIRVRREVILSAGAFQTPQLLMLSGVGEANSLASLGLPIIHNLPGVGENLQDHPDFIFGYTSDSPNFIGASASGAMKVLKGIMRYRRERRGLLTSNFGECGGFLKTRSDIDVPDIQIHLLLTIVDDHGRKLWHSGGFGCHVCLLRPKSRGSVRLKSGDVSDAPLIDPNFLGEEEDVQGMVAAYKTARRLMDAPAMKTLRKKDVFTQGIETDDDIRTALRQRVDTVYHPAGSCKMGVDDPMAVVDPRSKVYGVDGLRIVDASIMPNLVGGNTNAPTIMIGEKAADMIRMDARA